MKRKFIYIIFLIFSIFQSTTYSQNPQWRVFTTANSPLPSNLIGSIVVDSNNVKWIGTDNGMVRIEGNDWQIFDSTNTPLGTSGIYPVTFDLYNNIWVSTIKGMGKYDRTNWTIYDTSNSGIPSNIVKDIYIDSNNVKWIGTEGKGLVKYNDTNWVIFDTSNSGIPGNHVWALKIQDDIKWVGTFGAGLGRYDNNNWTVYNPMNSGIPSYFIRDITTDIQGNLWIATDFSGAARFNYNLNQWLVFNTGNSGIPSNLIICLLTDNEKKWIGTTNAGLTRFNDTNWVTFNPENSPLLDYSIISLGLDSNDNLWIGNIGLAIYNENGIIGINNQNENTPVDFVLYQNYPNPFNPITKIKYQITKNNMYVKLTIYDIRGKEITTLINKKQDIGIYTISFEAKNLPSGIYFYQLKTKDYSESKKMILIK